MRQGDALTGERATKGIVVSEHNAARPLDGQVALVTGGGGGIGRATALALHEAGAHVVVADLRGDVASTVATAIRRSGGNALACACDVTDAGSVSDLLRQTSSFGGRLDILINNAGAIHVTALESLPLDLWRLIFAVNVEGPLLLTQGAAALMRRQEPATTGCRGKIINVSSPAAEVGRPLLAAYGASKAALNHLSKSTALALADRLIATTVLYPGSVMEGMMGAVQEELSALEGRSATEMLRDRVAALPLGRFQSPEETAAMVVYIAAAHGMALNGRVVWSEAHVAAL